MDAKQTPLIELLDAVPVDARVIVEEKFASTSHPVGRLCHEAAAELRRLQARLTEAERVIKEGRLTLIMLEGDIEWRESSVTLRQLKRTLKAFDCWLEGEK